jgi:chemotaxis protein methyltransferase CheR
MMTNRTLGAITGEEYGRIRGYLTVKTGLVLREDKREELVALVSERMAQRAPPAGFPKYFSLLQAEGEAGSELRHLVSRLTVGDTHIFRNCPQIDVLRTRVLPDLIGRAREKGRSHRIWSAGCSTGEGPYSIAMLLLELLPDIADWAVTIPATDINVKSLDTAREGHFRNWSFREVDDYCKRRFFVEEDKGWRPAPTPASPRAHSSRGVFWRPSGSCCEGEERVL